MTTLIDQRRKAYADFQAGAKRDKTNRLAVAGKFFLYAFIAPLLLVVALAGLIWVAKQLGLTG